MEFYKHAAQEFFKGKGKDKVCMGKLHPNFTRLQDTLFFEVIVDDVNDE